jgi:hypothetical protein
MSVCIKAGSISMDFFCRDVWIYGDLTCEYYVLNLASRYWWLTPCWTPILSPEVAAE